MLKPRTPPNIVKVTEKINPKTSARLLSKAANLEKTVPVANVARETRTVSQPTKTRYERSPGTILPLTPKEARTKTAVGAFERFPASELNPTKKNEPTVPIIAAAVACLNEISNPKKKEP